MGSQAEALDGSSLNLAHPLGKVLVFLFLLLMCLLVVGALLLVLPGLH
jgi:hypothetical protein